MWLDKVDLFGDVDPEESGWNDPESRPAAWKAFGEDVEVDAS